MFSFRKSMQRMLLVCIWLITCKIWSRQSKRETWLTSRLKKWILPGNQWILWEICTRFVHYLYSVACIWIITQTVHQMLNMGSCKLIIRFQWTVLTNSIKISRSPVAPLSISSKNSLEMGAGVQNCWMTVPSL